MKTVNLILLQTLTVLTLSAQSDFLAEQKRYSRVRSALKDKEQLVSEKLRTNNLELGALNILILAFKAEGEIEVFAKKTTKQTYDKLVSYSICSPSGQVGPKREEGDLQVPEGFYFIDRFNPSSSFHLSLGLNYPNQSDRIKSNAANLGGDIFIHGACVTIGCIPITDDKIKELYLYAANAKNNGQQKIPVYIFPFRMTEMNFNGYSEKYQNNPELTGFWENLKRGYDLFVSEQKELNITVNGEGDYLFE